MPEPCEYGMLISFGAIVVLFIFTGGHACSCFGLLKEGLVPTLFRTKSKGNMQSDSFGRYCAMKKYFYELCEHKAIDELAFKKFA